VCFLEVFFGYESYDTVKMVLLLNMCQLSQATSATTVG